MLVLPLGAEIALFFNSFGKYGYYGIAVSAIVIMLVIYKVFSIIFNYNINTYNDFLNKCLNTNRKLLIDVINIIINIFLLISFFVMMSGILTFFKQELQIDNIFFSILIILICYFVLMKDLNGVIKINSILIPILIFFIIFIGLKSNNFSNTMIELNFKNTIVSNWLLSSLLYTSYNCVVLIPLLVSLKKEINNKKQFGLISIISGMIIGVLAVIIYRLLFYVGNQIAQIEMPLVYVAGLFRKNI